jgi:hypothetical protein
MSLSKQELMEINSHLDEISLKQSQNVMSLEEAYAAAVADKQRLIDTFSKTEPKDDFRVSVWKKSNDLVKVFEAEKFEADRSKGCRFTKDSNLDIEARAKIADVKIVINKMTFNGTKKLNEDELRYAKDVKKRLDKEGKETIVTDEQYALVRLSMLVDYGKYISSEHPEMTKLYHAYHDKCLSNYEDYAKGLLTSRSENRDAALASKISNNLAASKYSDSNKAQAVINLLQPVTK